MIRALVADDHAIVRHGIRDVLRESRDIVVKGEAKNAAEVLDKVRRERWDVVVLDLNLPDRSGLDLLGDLRRERPSLPVLILTVYSEDQFAIRAFRAGASGYLTKESAPEELVEAVRKVVRGGRYVSPALAERLALLLEGAVERPVHEFLSAREFEILRLLGSGKTVSQAAAGLHLSVKTVSTYRARLLEKMNLRTNAELTLYAVRNGLVD